MSQLGSAADAFDPMYTEKNKTPGDRLVEVCEGLKFAQSEPQQSPHPLLQNVVQLLDSSADPNFKDHNGNTSLYYACHISNKNLWPSLKNLQELHYECAKVLIERRADVNAHGWVNVCISCRIAPSPRHCLAGGAHPTNAGTEYWWFQ